MIETQSIERAFYADMKANPDDHSIPLIMADWLEENNQEDRASLIRCQDYLRRNPCGSSDLTSGKGAGKVTFLWNEYSKRQQELIGKNVFEWCYPMLAGRTWQVDGSKVITPEPTSGNRREYEIHFRHGFVSLIKCRLVEWYEISPYREESISGIDIAKHHPLLSRVEIADREPTVVPHSANPSSHRWYWIGYANMHESNPALSGIHNIIPLPLLKLMPGVRIIHDSIDTDGFDSAAKAKTALSDACLKWAIDNG